MEYVESPTVKCHLEANKFTTKYVQLFIEVTYRIWLFYDFYY